MGIVSMENLILYTGVIILINLILLSYVLKLEREKCDCSDNWMRDYIKYYTSVLIVLLLIILVIPVLTGNKKLKKMKPLFFLLRIIVLIATIVQVFAVFMYSQALNCKKTECECSNDWRSRFMYFLGIFGFVIYSVLIIAYIMCAFMNGPIKCLA